jgi:hypothetical protein
MQRSLKGLVGRHSLLQTAGVSISIAIAGVRYRRIDQQVSKTVGRLEIVDDTLEWSPPGGEV